MKSPNACFIIKLRPLNKNRLHVGQLWFIIKRKTHEKLLTQLLSTLFSFS